MRFAGWVQEVENVNSLVCDADLIHALVSHNDGRTFLPSLKRIHWYQTAIDGSSLSFLSSESILEVGITFERDNIHGIEISLDGLTPACQLVAPLLPSNFPFRSLATLNFFTRSLMGEFAISSLPLFNNLRILRMPSRIHPVAYDKLHSLSSRLEVLECALDTACNADVNPLHVPSLRVFKCCGRCKDLELFVSRTSAPKLVVAEFTDDHSCTVSTLRQLIAATCAPRFSESLRSLSFCASALYGQDDEDADVGPIDDVLRPCQHVVGLESLTFIYPVSRRSCFSYSDESFLTLAQYLPNVKDLKILLPSTIGQQSISTLSLLYITQHCPLVRELHLSVDVFSVVDPVSTPMHTLNPRHSLTTLVLLSRRVELRTGESMSRFSDVVDHLFPALDVEGSRCPNDYRSIRQPNPWHTVWTQVAAIQHGRRQYQAD